MFSYSQQGTSHEPVPTPESRFLELGEACGPTLAKPVLPSDLRGTSLPETLRPQEPGLLKGLRFCIFKVGPLFL